MRVLFISSVIPYRETKTGGPKRLYYLAKELARRSELHVVCFDGSLELQDFSSRSCEFEHFLFVEKDFARKGSTRSVLFPWYGKNLWEKNPEARKFLSGKEFDFAVLAYPLALPFLGRSLGATVRHWVYMEDDLLLEKILRKTKDGPLWKRGFASLRYSFGIPYYRWKLRQTSLFVGISPEERRFMQATFPETKTVLFKYGLPMEEIPFLPMPEGLEIVLGFIGNFAHHPNHDGMIRLLRDMVPQVLKEEKTGWKILVAGANLPEDIRNLIDRSEAKVEYAGKVDDLKDFYSRIHLLLNPIFDGGGLRTKLIEAAAYGRPIASTKWGAAGTEELLLKPLENAGDLLALVRDVMARPKEYAAIAAENRRVAEKVYSIESQGDMLFDALEEISASDRQPDSG